MSLTEDAAYCDYCTRDATGWVQVQMHQGEDLEKDLCDFHADRLWARYRRLKWERTNCVWLHWHPYAAEARR
jgi:hypothetical protein